MLCRKAVSIAAKALTTEHRVKQEISEQQRKHGILIGAVVAVLLRALPLAVWLD